MFNVTHVRWLSKREVFGRFLELRHAVKPSVSERSASYPEIDDYNGGALLKAAA
jgi:predicted GNAT family N-acyltransferase